MRYPFLIILIFSFLIGNGQKDGFDLIRIGKSLYGQEITNNYEQQFSSPDSLIFRIQPTERMSICKEGIDYLNVKVNRDSTIAEVELFTVARVYQSNNDFLSSYRDISSCLVGQFGKADYLDEGKANRDNLKTAIWYFPDIATMFIVYAYDLPYQPNSFKRFYKMVWKNYDPKQPNKF